MARPAADPLTGEPGAGAIGHGRSAGSRAGVLAVIGTFLAVRVVYIATGGRFSTDVLRYSWQLLEPSALRADPFGSVALLHSQPPLFNLFVGIVERWSPFPAGLSFQFLYLASGLTMVLALRALLAEVGCSEVGATVGALVVALNPVVLSYETTVTYEIPVATGLVIAVWLAARFARTRRTGDLVGCVLAATFATLTRALLHPVWLVAFVAIVLLATRASLRRRTVLAVIAVPVVLVGGWVLKNQILFGEPSLSSMAGSSLGRGVIATMPRTVVDDLVRSGSITPAARVRPFSTYDAYLPAIGRCRTTWTQPVVRTLIKRSGIGNFNADCYLRVDHQQLDNALVLLRERPGDYLGTRSAPAAMHFVHGLAPGLGTQADNWVYEGLGRVWDPALMRVDVDVRDGGWNMPLLPNLPDTQMSVTLLAATCFVLGVGTRSAVRLLRPSDERRPEDVGRVLIALTVGFIALVSILTEFGENGRFRFLVDPLVLGLAVGMLVTTAARVLARWRSTRSPLPESPDTTFSSTPT